MFVLREGPIQHASFPLTIDLGIDACRTTERRSPRKQSGGGIKPEPDSPTDDCWDAYSSNLSYLAGTEAAIPEMQDSYVCRKLYQLEINNLESIKGDLL